MNRPLRRRTVLSGAAATAALGMTGCLQNPDPGGSGGTTVERYSEGDTPGTGTVTVLGAFGGQEQEAFLASLEDFQSETGISVQYTPDSDFTTTVQQRVGAGDAPDIALFPQPGGLFNLADHIVPIDVYLDYDALAGTLIPGFLDSARLGGRVYGAPMRMACKSLIWYPRKAYEEGGYSAEPATMQELYGIADEIAGDGITPWSDAWGAEQATGWVGTDWIEEFMLRVHGPEIYDDWIYHRIPFNSPEVVEVFDIVGDLLKSDDVLGGVDTILSTPFSEAPLPLFEDPARAMFVRQGNFVTGFFPEDVQENLDEEVGVFAMPTWEGGFDGQPILGGGDLAALFTLNDDTVKLMQFLSSPEFGGPWAGAGGWLSPHKTFDDSQYADETTRTIARIAAEAQVFRYDGSDVMPAAVGGGSFWSGMVQWLRGDKDSQTVCDEIEAGWPA
ncbi:ABC transporter substrate-binding protein [Brachybacterium saurashtrense]|uniref:Carbohydrate ABC transporter substrate-binding protein n=1 Tax=Brachybacterium saurashtrense TaxID=556288 RepID=A0A345YQ36_9MICO|nr:ABC transporter substrate-binding protein [Brachybacterium saurashtrense]AXK46038.1 carbohydrate ABC transporter substrate-binding protein [Brachybacterium saurashtrense]RRR23777.1 carbohydrate ABC transporter substrate-binding protein [Brachybacterium saurashtrense]